MYKIVMVVLGFLLISMVGLTQKPTTITNFKLLNVDGKYVCLSDFTTAKGFMIIFTSNHCPFAKLYPERLNRLNLKYTPLGIPVIAISSTDTVSYEEDTFDKMVAKATQERFNFPYLYDGTQAIAKEFGAQRTPHAFLIWKENDKWIVKYNGAIDDNGAHPELVQNNYLENAVNELLLGKEIIEKETRSIGCQIYFRK